MSSSKPQLYEFVGSCWANVPKLALSEAGYNKDDVEFIAINLVELRFQGKNFEPEYLKINPNGTVPTYISNGKTYTDSTTAVSAILREAPHPPRVSAHTSTSIIDEIHGEAHDPNASLLISISDEDRQNKINGVPKAFLSGRQKALDKLVENPPAEFKDFLTKKQAFNKSLLDFLTGEPDEATKNEIYSKGKELWKSSGIVIRGVITQALQKTEGPYAGGKEPSEVDFHIITWLSRVISNTGVEPGSPASKAIPVLQKWTGGHEIDPVVGKYWDAWIARDSFKDNGIH